MSKAKQTPAEGATPGESKAKSKETNPNPSSESSSASGAGDDEGAGDEEHEAEDDVESRRDAKEDDQADEEDDQADEEDDRSSKPPIKASVASGKSASGGSVESDQLTPQGEYANWLDVEFDLSDRMAQRFVNVYERIGTKSDIMSDLNPLVCL